MATMYCVCGIDLCALLYMLFLVLSTPSQSSASVTLSFALHLVAQAMGTERVEKHRITKVQIDQNPFPSCVHSIEGEAMVSIPDQRFTYLRHLASRTRQGDDFHRLKLVAHANH